MATPFYWRHARDSLLTTAALRMFQILAQHDGRCFDEVKQTIDDSYRQAVGSTAESRHGGIIQTQLQAFREAGWVSVDKSTDPRGLIVITPAGKQALLLLQKVPDFLKAAPYFVVELLSRYQLNNPARPDIQKNAEYDAALAESTVFPYWTLLKVMRSCGDMVTTDELRRFVFQIKRHEDIQGVIDKIKDYRTRAAGGASAEDLDKAFPTELEGSIGEPKYLMGRLGTQVGGFPSLVEREGSTYRLNKYYLPFVDVVLANEPVFHDYLDEATWMRDYAKPVSLDAARDEGHPPEEDETPLAVVLPDDDPIYRDVYRMCESSNAGVLFSGPPGTSKTWYARQVAIKLVDGDAKRVRFVQFHPSMGYDDFVEGYVPALKGEYNTFEVRKKLFLRLCDQAIQCAPKRCILVIDEMNRGDTGRIFGELLTYIEFEYRNTPFSLAYSGRTTKIPPNIFIIATYNPFDKSVVELDDAIDRRFERIAFEPNPQLLATLLKANGVGAELSAKLVTYMVEVNKLCRHGIGHTYFLTAKDDDSLRRLWQHKLKFVLEKALRFDAEALKSARDKYRELFTNQDAAGI